MNKSNEENLKKTFSKILKINKSKISENLNTKNCEKWDSSGSFEYNFISRE